MEEYNIKEFEQLHKDFLEKYDEIVRIIKCPTVGDVRSTNLRKILETIKNYKEKVPEELKEKFNLNINKLEKGILDLQEKFIKD